jgi:hypothetical protein
MSDNEFEEPQKGVSRRTVTKAMAWAVPVIAVAAPVPAFAVSGGIIEFSGQGCKLPGNSQSIYKGYAFRMTASNTTNFPVTVNITSATLNNSNLGTVTVVDLNTCTTFGNPFNIPANTTYNNLVLLTADAPNSQNGTLVVNFTVDGQGGQVPASVFASGLGPIQGSCGVFSQAEINCINGK